ncbi:MAG: hypothetical protein HOP15_17185, partial [Planctomycetes bacterium]|nr:hypothetical protein [Planctomycetota bacterium]
TQDSASETLVLEVLDGRTNAPAADVGVYYATSKRLIERECLAQRHSRFAPSVRTDSKGLARLPVPHATAIEVIATGPGLLGEAVCAARAPGEAGERRERLVLLHDWDLLVEVVDDALQPAAGVELGLRARAEGGAAKKTGRDGRATFARVGHELERSPGQALRVWASLPLQENVEVLVEHEPPAGEPVRLRLPPLGSVEVDVLSADGTPSGNGMRVTLRLVKPGEREVSPFAEAQQRRTSETIWSGHALFERVSLGHELELTAERGPERARIFVAGPQLSGERVQATLRLAHEVTLLRFRAMDREGQAVVAGLFTNVLAGTESSWGGQNRIVFSDPKGYFEVRLETVLAEGERRELEVHARERGLSARIDLSQRFPPGRIDMGNLVLEQAPLIAEGRVVDAAGEPVAGASIGWMRANGEERTSTLSAHHTSERSETNAEGAFSLRGFVEARRVQLFVHHSRLRCEPLEVALGARGVELVMRGTGGLAGRLLLDPGVPMKLGIGLRENGTQAFASQIKTKSEPDGHFECRHVPAGTYTLSVAIDGDVLCEVQSIVVVADEVTRDPRIQALDLRGRLHVFRLELVPPSPGTDMKSSVSYVEHGSAGRELTLGQQSTLAQQRQGDAVLDIVTPLARIDATVRVAGCRVERLSDLGPRTEVRLRAGYPVRLALPVGVLLPEPPFFLGVSLGGEDAGWFAEGARFFDERGEALVHASEAGRARIRWILERRRDRGANRGGLALPAEQFVVVADLPGEQRFELALTSEDLAAALRAR